MALGSAGWWVGCRWSRARSCSCSRSITEPRLPLGLPLARCLGSCRCLPSSWCMRIWPVACAGLGVFFGMGCVLFDDSGAEHHDSERRSGACGGARGDWSDAPGPPSGAARAAECRRAAGLGSAFARAQRGRARARVDGGRGSAGSEIERPAGAVSRDRERARGVHTRPVRRAGPAANHARIRAWPGRLRPVLLRAGGVAGSASGSPRASCLRRSPRWRRRRWR